MNKSDAERIASVLCDAGFTETKKESEADIIVTFACSVRQSAINRIYGKIKEWQDIRTKRPLTTILSGCVLKEDRVKMKKYFDLIFDIKELQKLKQFLEQNPKSETLNPKQYQNQNDKKIKDDVLNFENWDLFRNSKLEIRDYEDYFSINPIRESSFMAYVPISTGCNNFCTYCAVPYTRGREVSRPMDEIVKEVRELVDNGYKEITLLGQNVNSYTSCHSELPARLNSRSGGDSESIALDLDSGSESGMTNSDNFTDLLKKIDGIEGVYRVYFYSNHPKDISTELIKILPKLEHFPHYIHLPLQSGSDKILKKMNRHYTQKQYLELAEKIKKNIPEVAITTDIIVGFPGETEEDFSKTKKVMKEVGFSIPFIAKYSPRPGTIAAKMKDDVSKEEKEKRWRKLTDIQKKILEKENKKLVGRTLTILIDSEKKGKYYGRTDNYKVVEISAGKDSPCTRTVLAKQNKKQTSLIGQFVNVEIISSKAWILKGIIV